MELMLVRLLLLGFCFSITYQGWIVPIKDSKTKYPLYNNTIKITTDSVYGSEDIVCFLLYTNTGNWITYITWTFTDWSYYIHSCSKYNNRGTFTTPPPPAVDKTWEVYKTATYLDIKCNGVTVLHYVYSDSDWNPGCSNTFKYQTVATVVFSSSYDSATKEIYLNDRPGCRGFEAEWMIKGIENSADIEVPIPHGTVVPIKCTGSNRKLSGPDNITCLENNTFSGLSDINCSGWIVPIKVSNAKYPVYNNTIKITTNSESGSEDKVQFTLNTNTGNWITAISWSFKDWSYYIASCTKGKNNFTTQPPPAVNRTWEVYKAATYLDIKCNGVTVLHYVYDDADMNPECGNSLNKTVATVTFSDVDSATRKFYLNDIDKHGTCPSTHPFAYWTENSYCCKYNKEKINPKQGAACDGSAIHPGSMCCKSNARVRCPIGKGCTNYR